MLVCTVHGPYVAHRMRGGELYGYGAAPAGTWQGRLLGWVRGHVRYQDGAARIARLVRQYERHGFGYLDNGSGTYGISLSKPSWVLRQLEGYPDLRVVSYVERGWDEHQDAVICLKAPFGASG